MTYKPEWSEERGDYLQLLATIVVIHADAPLQEIVNPLFGDKPVGRELGTLVLLTIDWATLKSIKLTTPCEWVGQYKKNSRVKVVVLLVGKA